MLKLRRLEASTNTSLLYLSRFFSYLFFNWVFAFLTTLLYFYSLHLNTNVTISQYENMIPWSMKQNWNVPQKTTFYFYTLFTYQSLYLYLNKDCVYFCHFCHHFCTTDGSTYYNTYKPRLLLLWRSQSKTNQSSDSSEFKSWCGCWVHPQVSQK